MQALILAGGEGTRLRPLTHTVPKPVLPLAGRPHIAYVVDWLVRHGVDDVVVSCGHLAEGMRRVIAELEPGVEIRYAEEPDARGTAGAIRFAEDMLGDRRLSSSTIAPERGRRSPSTPSTIRPDTGSSTVTTTARSPSSWRSRRPIRSTPTRSMPAPTCSIALCSSRSRRIGRSRSSVRSSPS
jgi:hypothetical protein